MFSYFSYRFWTIISLVFLVIIVISAIMIWIRFPRGKVIEISLKHEPEYETNINIAINGAVNNPGIYYLKSGDTLESLLNAAGGITQDANTTEFIFTVPSLTNTQYMQKIDINHAESWLLEALPGIGETLAQRIIQYRELHGPYKNINEITLVDGLTQSTYEKIKDYIIVSK
jgi:competence protein ComEA